MVRRHGWQLPAHVYQVVAITVFLLLATAFYVFFAPFLGNPAAKVSVIAVYSSVALAVLILYVRCTAINPADPGISSCKWKPSDEKGPLTDSPLVVASGLEGTAHSSQMSITDRSPSIQHLHRNASTLCLLGCLFGWLVKGDNCRKKGMERLSAPDEDVLYCTLCNSEVCKYSKHCRSCDKCVDGFDHHCRWLNNCVGRKNYITFVSLMATCLVLLVLDWSIGLVVLVRCFIDKKNVEKQIVSNLGSGFSRAPFAAVVAVCTLVPLLASIPLGELFFFHILLIRKGITTYEYVVAMRAQSEPHEVPDVEQRSAQSSPTSSTVTGLSGSSSLGLQHRGAWCTPPRVFVEYQEDEVIPHLDPGRIPSTIDPDTALQGRVDIRPNKRGVRISAWKLAKLDPNKAVQAASKARENSSVLRPIGLREVGSSEMGYSSSSNVSVHSSMAADYGGVMGSRREFLQDIGSPRTAYPPSRATSKDGLSGSNLSSPGRTTVNSSARASPSPLEKRSGVATGLPRPRGTQSAYVQGGISSGTFNCKHSLPVFHATAISSSSVDHPPLASSTLLGDTGANLSVEDNADNRRRNSGLMDTEASQPQVDGNFSKEERSAVYWDRIAGRYMSVPTRNHLMRISTPCFTRQSKVKSGGALEAGSPVAVQREIGHSSPDNFSNLQQGSAPSGSSSLVSAENLTYSGTSIFFGGPLSIPVPGSVRKEDSSTGNPAVYTCVSQSNHHLEPVLRSQSPVFEPPGLSHENKAHSKMASP